ncbi:hypothetical protein ACRAWC_24410 [Leifsonia sp. L25]|uniref:hypothetical protein n=1 Tax=Leifsonia TaxID=110932 RepID=UPI003D670B71
MRRVRIATALLLSACLIAGLTACSLIGDRLMTPDPPVKELQRESAIVFRDKFQPNVEKIRFTRDGGRPGLGASWSVNAIATVGGSDYYVIIGPDGRSVSYVGGTGMPPDAPTPFARVALTVIYSDGTSELIE